MHSEIKILYVYLSIDLSATIYTPIYVYGYILFLYILPCYKTFGVRHITSGRTNLENVNETRAKYYVCGILKITLKILIE